MTKSITEGLCPEFNFSRDSGVALWDAVYSITIWAIKFLGHVIKVNNGDFLDVSYTIYWVLNCYLVKCYVFVGFLFPKLNFFSFFLTIASAQQSQSSWIFCFLWLRWNIMSSWFISHGKHGEENNTWLHHRKECGFANGLLKKLNAKCFDSFHFSVLNIKANRINLLKIKILS